MYWNEGVEWCIVTIAKSWTLTLDVLKFEKLKNTLNSGFRWTLTLDVLKCLNVLAQATCFSGWTLTLDVLKLTYLLTNLVII